VTDETRAGEKKQRLLQALELGVTQIHLDARRQEVLVPERYRTDHHLVLNLSYRYPPRDLDVTEWGVRQTLEFAGEPFLVSAPWAAVYAVISTVSREVWMFPDDMPDELAEAPPAQTAPRARPDLAVAGREPRPSAPPTRTVLREVVLERPEGEGEVPKEASPPRKGHLRVVK
jgi:stringent starvation protein B